MGLGRVWVESRQADGSGSYRSPMADLPSPRPLPPPEPPAPDPFVARHWRLILGVVVFVGVWYVFRGSIFLR